MQFQKIVLALVLALGSSATLAQDYVVSVNGFVCEFCAFGISKKVSKLTFLDRTRLEKGISMDPENQLVTIAVKTGETLDVAELTDAIESAGYNIEEIYTLSATGQREVWQP